MSGRPLPGVLYPQGYSPEGARYLRLSGENQPASPDIGLFTPTQVIRNFSRDCRFRSSSSVAFSLQPAP